MSKQNDTPQYDPSAIEPKWQEKWDAEKVYSPNLDTAKKPFYNLMMFPYPSAEGLHVGNMYAFTGSDVYGRYKRMQGYDVFEPMGLDGFGIHSENYALKVGKHPKEQAQISQKNFYRQLKSIGNGFDFSRTLETYDPNYYQWTQWIFVQLFKAGLAYRKKAPVNFCPSCKTVLADEQVIDGKCERCSNMVEKRDLAQWFFRITEYADRLLNNLDTIDWAEKVKVAQKQWIGRSEGMEISFSVIPASEPESTKGEPGEIADQVRNDNKKETAIRVYTVFPETIYGTTFMVIAPEHPHVAQLTTKEQEYHVAQYIEKAKHKSELERTDLNKEKSGVFTGSYCINPVTEAKIPVYIADYVIFGYGTGAVMGVPGSDHRDFAFAKKYDLPVIQVISNDSQVTTGVDSEDKVLEKGYLVNSGPFTGLKTPDVAREKIKDFLEEKKFGKRVKQFHLRDWLISRQRYWGPPIPLIYCQACATKGQSYFSSQGGQVPNLASKQPQNEADMAGWFPVPEDQLPVLLPDVQDWKPKGTGTSPLSSVKDFVNVACPECGGAARRETDVSDTFLDSAWYFLRYTSTEDKTCPWMPERAKKWLPVDMYIGGAEHSVLHLLYSRFLTMVFKDLGLISHFEEPFKRFYAHGLIIKDGTKMSKSKGNVVVPDEYIRKFGADTLRSYLMFTGPYNMGGDFRDSGVEGMNRFMKRVWNLVVTCHPELARPEADRGDSGSPKAEIADQVRNDMDTAMNKAIKAVTEDLENLRYNTALAHIMTYYNSLYESYTQYKILDTKYSKTLILLLAPFAPHMTEELWGQLGQPFSIHASSWPTYDESVLKTDIATIAVQINGKLRDTLALSSSTPKEEVEKIAKEKENVKKFLDGKPIKKTIFVPGKIINFVL